MNRVGWILTWVLVLGWSSARSEDAPRRDAGRPNVIFIIADDLNTAIGPYGDPVAKTPHLDGLAARGVTFDRAYCQQAVCNPSRSSFLTGLRPGKVGVDDLRKYFRDTAPDGDQLITLPQYFKNAGYFCQDVGKVFHNMGDTQDRRSWSTDEQLHRGTHADDTVYRSQAADLSKLAMKSPVTESLSVPDTAYRDGRIGDIAAAVISDRSIDSEPFFLAVGFWRPHLPFVAPKRYWDLYQADEIPGPDPIAAPIDAPPIALHESKELFGYGRLKHQRTLTDSDVRHLRHGYYASISFMDAQIGKVLTALHSSPHADNTIVAFVSDHGFHIGEHSLWGKTTNFELDARVPLIVSAPGLESNHGRHARGICELVDLYPTLADLAGLHAGLPSTLDGISLVPMLRDPDQSVKPFALTRHQQPFYGSPSNWKAWGFSMRTPGWRLTQWRDVDDPRKVVATELYDFRTNSQERQNVVDDPANQSVVDQLTETLEANLDMSAMTEEGTIR
ncbi:Choline-sulfatase [Rubripirellula lacrimiformis]|uniref:Choline-sulfatase n=1 Tax=Rubripirellula lacrimiformis TaxID=1930273 RepID=A0A517NKB8_9BACT|nr:sulfatase [Rubripirellula lacrimiformis]QDT07588.1 Choline-sulfatase [Rubripirellula lacrimiformis]